METLIKLELTEAEADAVHAALLRAWDTLEAKYETIDSLTDGEHYCRNLLGGVLDKLNR